MARIIVVMLIFLIFLTLMGCSSSFEDCIRYCKRDARLDCPKTEEPFDINVPHVFRWNGTEKLYDCSDNYTNHCFEECKPK